jgi:hypothetical protein
MEYICPKNMRKQGYWFLLVLLQLKTVVSLAQTEQLAMGQWQTFFDFAIGNQVELAQKQLYYAGKNGLLSINTADSEVTIYGKGSGFLDLTFNKLAYIPKANAMVFTNPNGLISYSLCKPDGSLGKVQPIFSLRDQNSSIGSKTCRQVWVEENLVYLIYDFGLLVLDLSKKALVQNIQNLGPKGQAVPIRSFAIANGIAYLLTSEQLLQAPVQSNLADFSQWKRQELFQTESTKAWLVPSAGALLLFSENNGIIQFQNGAFKPVNTLFNSVYQVHGKSVENLYLSTDQGFGKFNSANNSLTILSPSQVADAAPFNTNIFLADPNTGLSQLSNGVISAIALNKVQAPAKATQQTKNITDTNGLIWTSRGSFQGVSVRDPATNVSVNFSQIPLRSDDTRISSNTVNSFALDRNGLLLLACNGGIVGINTAKNIATATSLMPYVATLSNRNGERILANDLVTSVAIDGGNRKWIGTQRGLFLFDPEISTILQNFTTENSPLSSNNIKNLYYETTQSRLYVQTDQEVLQYRVDASEATDTQSKNIQVFPNPVPVTFDGPLTIEGLVAEATVYITTLEGRLVFKGAANGGTLTWNLQGPSGQRVAPGVYLILSSNSLGKQTIISKLAIL